MIYTKRFQGWIKTIKSQRKVIPFKSSRCIKASFYIHDNILNFPTTKAFRMEISMKLIYQYMAIFFNFSPTSNHLHPLQVENCDSNSRLVVDEDDNGKFKLERVKWRCLGNIRISTRPPGCFYTLRDLVYTTSRTSMAEFGCRHSCYF